MTEVLTAAGIQVVTANFAEAKARLGTAAPHLLVADVCQREYNGLQLVIRGLSSRRGMVALVTCPYADVVLQREAEAMGATYIVKPISRTEMLAAVARTIWRDREMVVPIRPPFERRRGDRRQMPTIHVGADRRSSERRRLLEASLA